MIKIMIQESIENISFLNLSKEMLEKERERESEREMQK